MAQLQVKYELTGVEGLKRRQINNAIRDALHEVGLYWHRTYLPLHFKNSATTRYGYAPRSGERGSGRRWKGSYTHRKLKKYGHTRPLEYTGDSKRQALRSANVTAKATSSSAHVTVLLPQAFNRRNPKGKTRPADEIRAVIPSELRDMERVLVREIENNLTQAGQREARATASLTTL